MFPFISHRDQSLFKLPYHYVSVFIFPATNACIDMDSSTKIMHIYVYMYI